MSDSPDTKGRTIHYNKQCCKDVRIWRSTSWDTRLFTGIYEIKGPRIYGTPYLQYVTCSDCLVSAKKILKDKLGTVEYQIQLLKNAHE